MDEAPSDVDASQGRVTRKGRRLLGNASGQEHPGVTRVPGAFAADGRPTGFGPEEEMQAVLRNYRREMRQREISAEQQRRQQRETVQLADAEVTIVSSDAPQRLSISPTPLTTPDGVLANPALNMPWPGSSTPSPPQDRNAAASMDTHGDTSVGGEGSEPAPVSPEMNPRNRRNDKRRFRIIVFIIVCFFIAALICVVVIPLQLRNNNSPQQTLTRPPTVSVPTAPRLTLPPRVSPSPAVFGPTVGRSSRPTSTFAPTYIGSDSRTLPFGQELYGQQTGDLFGSSVATMMHPNANGQLWIAIGSKGHDVNRGVVRIMETTTFTQIGQDIEGNQSQALFGSFVVASTDGKWLALGGVNMVQLYHFNFTSLLWQQAGRTLGPDDFDMPLLTGSVIQSVTMTTTNTTTGNATHPSNSTVYVTLGTVDSSNTGRIYVFSLSVQDPTTPLQDWAQHGRRFELQSQSVLPGSVILDQSTNPLLLVYRDSFPAESALYIWKETMWDKLKSLPFSMNFGDRGAFAFNGNKRMLALYSRNLIRVDGVSLANSSLSAGRFLFSFAGGNDAGPSVLALSPDGEWLVHAFTVVDDNFCVAFVRVFRRLAPLFWAQQGAEGAVELGIVASSSKSNGGELFVTIHPMDEGSALVVLGVPNQSVTLDVDFESIYNAAAQQGKEEVDEGLLLELLQANGLMLNRGVVKFFRTGPDSVEE